MRYGQEVIIGPSPTSLAQAYERGLMGAYWNPAAAQRLQDDIASAGGQRYGEDACREYGIQGSGAGKLSLPYMAVTQRFPKAIPGVAQERGDCVSFSTRTAIWISYMSELLYGDNPDRESVPDIAPTAEKSGCISSEALYWFRGHSGEGWVCAEAADTAIKKSAMWIRKPYPEIGIDLTEYSPHTAGKWGAAPPPPEVVAIGQRNLCRNATVCRTYESVRDMLAQGYALSTCGSEAFQNQRNEYGVAPRNRLKSWAHAMAYGAVDDRPETVAREGCGLVLVINSWGENWISGNRKIAGTEHSIPQGCFWARWTDLDNRYAIAMGPSKGWPARRMPNWGLGGIMA